MSIINFYTTVNMIHTMETLLGLPPMNLFDAHAPLMAPLFAGPGTQPPYQADDRNLRNGLIYRVNEKKAAGRKRVVADEFLPARRDRCEEVERDSLAGRQRPCAEVIKLHRVTQADTRPRLSNGASSVKPAAN